MGRFADFFREQSITLDGQKKAKMLSLDQEFAALQQEVQTLRSEVLHLKKETEPLRRENERLQNEIKKVGAQDHAKLDELAEKILLALANGEHDRDRIFARLSIAKIKGDYLYDILYKRELIESNFGITSATPLGREYLIKNGLV